MRAAVDVVVPDGDLVPCVLVDLSEGGARVRGHEVIPQGPIQLVLGDRLGLDGLVVDELIDVDSGLVTTRIAFEAAPAAEVTAAPPGRRRGRAVLALLGTAAAVALLVIALSNGSDDPGDADPDVGGQPAAARRDVPASRPDADQLVPGPSAEDGAPAPGQIQAPSVDPAPAPTPAPASPPPAASPAAPATVTTQEAADNSLTVTIAEDPAQNSAESSVGPSPGFDRIRVALNIDLEPTPSGYPVELTIENRDDQPLTFDGGLDAVFGARRDGAVVETVTLHRADITELAPGASAKIEGFLALAEPGTYQLFGSIDDVTAHAEA